MITYYPSTDILGFVMPGIQVKILDIDSGDALGPGEVGEIVAKGPFMTPGYWKKPEKNEELFTNDGFMRIGDMGHYDDDGLLHYDGRQKELMKPSGIDVFPFELEEIIAKHPGVKEVAVFGRPDQVLYVSNLQLKL